MNLDELVKNLSNDVSYRKIIQGVDTLARTAPLLVEFIENEEELDKISDSVFSQIIKRSLSL